MFQESEFGKKRFPDAINWIHTKKAPKFSLGSLFVVRVCFGFVRVVVFLRFTILRYSFHQPWRRLALLSFLPAFPGGHPVFSLWTGYVYCH